MLNLWRPAQILIVEDETFIALMLQHELESAGHQVLKIVSNLREGLQALNECRPDLVLLDHNLGSETSLEIAANLNHLGVPYILCTAHKEIATSTPTYRPVGSLDKPIDFERLQALVALHAPVETEPAALSASAA